MLSTLTYLIKFRSDTTGISHRFIGSSKLVRYDFIPGPAAGSCAFIWFGYIAIINISKPHIAINRLNFNQNKEKQSD